MRVPGWLRVAAQVAVSLALLGAVLWWAGPLNLVRELGDADVRWLVAAGLVFAVVTTIHGVRWWVLLRHVGRVPLSQTVLALLVAKALGVLLPLRAGAVLQVQLLGRRYDLDRGAVAGTLVLEAVLDAACFLTVFLIAAPFLGSGYVTAGIWVMAIAVGLALIGLVLLARYRRGSHEGAPAGGLLGKARRLLDAVRQGFAAVRSPAAVAAAVALTFVDWLLAAAGYALVGRAFGLDIPAGNYLVVEILANLSGAVPFTQSGIGVDEVAVTRWLTSHDVPAATAAAYAVGGHGLMLLAALVTGGIALLFLRVRPSEVLYLRREAGPPVASAPSPAPSPVGTGEGETAPRVASGTARPSVQAPNDGTTPDSGSPLPPRRERGRG